LLTSPEYLAKFFARGNNTIERIETRPWEAKCSTPSFRMHTEDIKYGATIQGHIYVPFRFNLAVFIWIGAPKK
jgi:hypothetical protein